MGRLPVPIAGPCRRPGGRRGTHRGSELGRASSGIVGNLLWLWTYRPRVKEAKRRRRPCGYLGRQMARGAGGRAGPRPCRRGGTAGVDSRRTPRVPHRPATGADASCDRTARRRAEAAARLPSLWASLQLRRLLPWLRDSSSAPGSTKSWTKRRSRPHHPPHPLHQGRLAHRAKKSSARF